MKIRSDYVSNSSSSSFIISVTKELGVDKFIDDVVKACSEKQDYEYTKEQIEDIDKFNRRNLDYCLNTYQLLFLGNLKMGMVKVTLNEGEDIDFFKKHKSDCYENVNILKELPEEIVYEEPRCIFGITVPKNVMEWTIRCFYHEKTDTIEQRKLRVDNILKCAEACHTNEMWFRAGQMETCEITLDTIRNTEDLLAEGKEIVFDKWCEDLESLKERIANGERIFKLMMNQGGDGMSLDAVYALNGWDSDFNTYANVEILCVETY